MRVRLVKVYDGGAYENDQNRRLSAILQTISVRPLLADYLA